MTVTDNMSAFFVSMYQNNGNSLGFLISSSVPKLIMLETYDLFIQHKEILKIEDLPVERKMELLDKCRGTGLKFNNQKLTDACRILHTLNEINENS